MGSFCARSAPDPERSRRVPPDARVGRRHRTLQAATAIVLLAAAVVFTPALPTCPIAGALGLPCPGCGLTRASQLLLAGQLEEALRLQPLTPLVLALAATLVGGSLCGYIQRGELTPPWAARHPRASRALEALAAAVALGLIAIWVARFAGCCGGPVPTGPRWSETLRALAR